MSHWKHIRRAVLERDNYTCWVCGWGKSNQVHHICARQRGGTHDMSNLMTLCGRCHAMISPVPDWVISKVWKIPRHEVTHVRSQVWEAYKRTLYR